MIFKDLAKDVNKKSFHSTSSFYKTLFTFFLFMSIVIKNNFLLIIFIFINILIIKSAFLTNSPQFAELSSSIVNIVIK